MTDVLILNHTAHEIPSSECATALKRRLDDREVTLAASANEELSIIPEAKIVVGYDLRPELLEKAANLRLFACSSSGVGHLDLDALAELGIAVTNAAGVHGPNIAEHVLGWMLMITRRLDEGIERQKRHEWRHFKAFDDLQGSRVCVVGLGAIGNAIVDRLDGFDVETVGVRYTPEKGGPTDEVYGFDEIVDALTNVDYLVIACPLTETTEGLIGELELSTLPHDAIVINIGRGPIIDTDSLVDTLRSNRLRAAALDVTDPEPLPEGHPLWNFDNTYITPHCSGYTPHYWERVANILVRNLERVDENNSFDGLENQII